MTSLTRISPLLALAILCGCQQPRHEACNPADSAAHLRPGAKMLCLRRFHRSVPRSMRLDALQVAKPNPGPKDDGASKALTH